MRTIPEVGEKITFTRNKITGDRSYTDDLWEVIAVNTTHVKLKRLADDDVPWKRQIIAVLSEHDFSLASDF